MAGQKITGGTYKAGDLRKMTTREGESYVSKEWSAAMKYARKRGGGKANAVF